MAETSKAGFCSRCGSPRNSGLFCANCGQAYASTAAPSAAPVPTDVSKAKPKQSGCANLIGAAVVLFVLYYILKGTGTTPTSSGSGGGGGGSSTVSVTYNLTGTAHGADLTYTDGSGNIQQQTGRAVPGSLSFVMAHGAFAQFSAQNTGETGDLTCTISANGSVINSGHATGGFAIVSCSAEVP